MICLHAIWFVMLSFFSSRGCAFKVGIQTSNGSAMVAQQFGPTFQYLGDQLQTNFQLLPYLNDSELNNAVINGSLDFVYGGPTLIYCIIVSANIQPLATLVSYQVGIPTGVLSGSIVTLQNSTINTGADLKGKVIGVGLLTGLTTFQAEFQYLSAINISLFVDARAVVRYDQPFKILNAVAMGDIDAGFVQTGLIQTTQASGLISNSTQFKVLDSAYYEGQPLPSTTQPYSSQVLAASSSINNTFRTALVKSLIGLQPNSTALVEVHCAGWFTPQSFLTIRKLVQSTGLLPPNESSCVDLTAVYAAVTCPYGYERMPDADLTTSCRHVGFPCPASSSLCVCSPCSRITAASTIGALSRSAFAGILVGIVFLMLLLIALIIRKKMLSVPLLPWEHINFGSLRLTQRRDSGLLPGYILGKSQQGYVLKADFLGRPVACKRAARLGSKLSIFDKVKAVNEIAPKKGLTPLYVNMLDFIGVETKRKRVLMRLHQQSALQHPNIVRMFGCMLSKDGSEVIAVFEFAERGSLDELLHNPTIELSVATKAKLALDIAKAMAYLHKQKPPKTGAKLRGHHLLISSDYSCMVNLSVTQGKAKDRTGYSRALLPPEVLNDNVLDDFKVDVYAFGMLLYEIFHGREAFLESANDPLFLVRAIADTTASECVRPEIDSRVPVEVQGLMQACWRTAEDARPSFQEIINVLDPMAVESLTDAFILGQEQQNKLLRQMLPHHVREALQNNTRPDIEEFPAVTTYFSDVVDYTALTASQPAKLVLEMMNELYTVFDHFCIKHGLLKIDTAGDSYFAVAGLQNPASSDHAARAAYFALDCAQAASMISRAGSSEQILIRVGLNSGPVISGVVGTTLLPKYSILGDTVNVGSRMESTSKPGYIQMSEFTHDLICMQDPALKRRLSKRAGQVKVKGKPDMTTWWLLTDENLRDP